MKKKIAPSQIGLFRNLIDICIDDTNTPVFLVKEQNELITQKSIIQENIEYSVPPKHSMPWLLPRADQVIKYLKEDDFDLFEAIQKKIQENCYLPDKQLYHFFTAWILHTHLIDKFNYSPIMIFFAVAARGKTRTCRTLLWMSRRGIHVETIREADIIRKASRFGCTIFFDVQDISRKAESLGAEDILLGRFNKGVIIPRVTNPERNSFDDTQHFSCYGATLIASNEPVNKILNSRAIDIRMEQAPYSFENDIEEQDFLELKERCVAFRARWLNNDIPLTTKPAKDRLGDILRPISQIYQIAAPHLMDEFPNLVNKFLNDQSERQSETTEGEVIKTLIEIEEKINEGIFITDDVVEKINSDKNERYHLSKNRISRVIQSLGFEKMRKGNLRGYCYNHNLLKRLSEEYGLQEPFTKKFGESGESANANQSVTTLKTNSSPNSPEPPNFNSSESEKWFICQEKNHFKA